VPASPAAVDLRLGIVSPDLGAGAADLTGLGCPTRRGDEGRLQNSPRGSTCAAAHLIDTADHFLTYATDGAGNFTGNFTGTVDQAFACYAALGVLGCGFDQPLAAVRQALDGSQPANDGFLRSDAFLAVVLLTDEDDCSMPADSMVARTDPEPQDLASHLGPLSGYRCFEFGVLCDGGDPGRSAGPRADCVPGSKDPEPQHQLTPVVELADFLKGLKADPRWVHVSAIAPDASPIAVVDQGGLPYLDTVCTTPVGSSCPAVRLAGFLAEFDPDRVTFNATCAADLQPALEQTGAALAALISP
jgi:hypothetical protein